MLRLATMDDLNLLYQWRNDPDVRKWSFHTEEITIDEHKKWFEISLERDDVEIFVLEEDGQAVGQIRLTYWYDELVIGYSVDRNFRGRHLGQRMVYLMEETLKNQDDLRKDGEYFVAYVQKKNTVSRRVFQVLDYSEEEQRKWVKYVKKIGK